MEFNGCLHRGIDNSDSKIYLEENEYDVIFKYDALLVVDCIHGIISINKYQIRYFTMEQIYQESGIDFVLLSIKTAIRNYKLEKLIDS
jgi:hypothetical protein